VQLVVDTRQNVTVVTVQEPSLDAASAPQFKADLTAFYRAGAQIVLDLTPVDFIDSAGLGAIIACLRRLRERDGDLRICGVLGHVRATFEMVRMDRILTLHRDVDAAISSF
jgi:anti-sigma B factor antagonist